MNGIVEKIRKLFAMAAPGSGATEAEMMTALEMAQALMVKYAIDQDALKTEVVPGVRRGEMTKEYDAWAQVLGDAAAELNMASAVYYGRNSRTLRFGFVGRPEAVTGAEATLRLLVGEVERLYKQGLPRGLDKASRAQFRRNFKFACSTRIQQRVSDIVYQLKHSNNYAMQQTGSTALVVSSTIDQRLREVAEWMTKNMNVKFAKPSKRAGGFGTMHGLRAGDQAAIQRGVSSVRMLSGKDKV